MIETYEFTNQATLLMEEIPYLRSAAVGVFIKVGSRCEEAKLAGASHFAEHMLFKGTAKRSARDIAENFENLGGQLNAFTSREYTCVYGRTLDEDIYTGIEIICDMLFNSQFLEKDFITEKEVVKEEIRMYEDSPDELIHDIFNQKSYSDDCLGHSILGTMETISQLTRDELFNYYKKHYRPENMIIAIAGNFDKNKIKDLLYANIVTNDKPEYSEHSIYQGKYTKFINLHEKKVEQVHICVGGPGISYQDERRYTLNVMNSILGGGMSSRLFQSLREQRGLAYSVYSYSSTYSDSGIFSIYIGTGNKKVAEFFAALHDELDRFINVGISDEELQRTKQMIKSSMYMGLESVISRMTRMARSIMMYGKYISPDEVVARIYEVDKQKVQDLAKELLNHEKMSLAVIGDKNVLPTVSTEFSRWYRTEGK